MFDASSGYVDSLFHPRPSRNLTDSTTKQVTPADDLNWTWSWPHSKTPDRPNVHFHQQCSLPVNTARCIQTALQRRRLWPV